jgi:hypothetical protein
LIALPIREVAYDVLLRASFLSAPLAAVKSEKEME